MIANPDRLTISRLMVLTAGLGFSLAVYAPRDFQLWPPDVDRYREMYSTLLIGLALPGVVYHWPRRGRSRPQLGGLLWLALSLGAWVLSPPAIFGPIIQSQAIGSSTAMACMHYLLPLMCVWILSAGWIGGALQRRSFRRTSAWRDRFGLYLGLAWSIQGVWLLGDIYWDAFVKQ